MINNNQKIKKNLKMSKIKNNFKCRKFMKINKSINKKENKLHKI